MKMATDNLVEGLPNISRIEKICHVCQFGKESRKPFPKQRSQYAKQKLKFVHINMCGPMRTPLLSHSKYYIVFIHDLTKFSQVYFLKQKLKASSKFLKFKIQAKNFFERKIKTLRVDNGSKYIAIEFEKLLAKLGVKHKLTVVYNSSKWGVREKK